MPRGRRRSRRDAQRPSSAQAPPAPPAPRERRRGRAAGSGDGTGASSLYQPTRCLPHRRLRPGYTNRRQHAPARRQKSCGVPVETRESAVGVCGQRRVGGVGCPAHTWTGAGLSRDTPAGSTMSSGAALVKTRGRDGGGGRAARRRSACEGACDGVLCASNRRDEAREGGMWGGVTALCVCWGGQVLKSQGINAVKSLIH